MGARRRPKGIDRPHELQLTMTDTIGAGLKAWAESVNVSKRLLAEQIIKAAVTGRMHHETSGKTEVVEIRVDEGGVF